MLTHVTILISRGYSARAIAVCPVRTRFIYCPRRFIRYLISYVFGQKLFKPLGTFVTLFSAVRMSVTERQLLFTASDSNRPLFSDRKTNYEYIKIFLRNVREREGEREREGKRGWESDRARDRESEREIEWAWERERERERNGEKKRGKKRENKRKRQKKHDANYAIKTFQQSDWIQNLVNHIARSCEEVTMAENKFFEHDKILRK